MDFDEKFVGIAFATIHTKTQTNEYYTKTFLNKHFAMKECIIVTNIN